MNPIFVLLTVCQAAELHSGFAEQLKITELLQAGGTHGCSDQAHFSGCYLDFNPAENFSRSLL